MKKETGLDNELALAQGELEKAQTELENARGALAGARSEKAGILREKIRINGIRMKFEARLASGDITLVDRIKFLSELFFPSEESRK
jgi:hypothetical protein